MTLHDSSQNTGSTRHRRTQARVFAALAAVATTAACTSSSTGGSGHTGAPSTSGTSTAAASSGANAASVMLSGAPVGATTHDTGSASAPGTDIAFVSHVYSLTPSGPLSSPATVTIKLDAPVPAGEVVVAATRESASQPWTYLPAHLNAARSAATFTTDHFSLFGLLGYDLAQLIKTFESDFIDGIDGGATETIARPQCTNETQSRSDGFSVTSSSTDTVYWCFGMNGSHRVLKVTDHRRYPLEIAHPNMDVLDNRVPAGQLSVLSHFGSRQHTILEPGATATFNADLNGGGSEAISTEMDGVGQSLYALQVGVQTAVQILTRFGVGSHVKAVDALDKILHGSACASTIKNQKGSGEVIASCFSAKQILDAFGVKGLLLAPLMVAGPLIAFFHSEWNALVDQFNSHDRYQIAIHRAAPSFAAFVGQWIGHTRDLKIGSSGAASESVGDGCCDPVIDVTYQLSNPQQRGATSTATASVTSVHVHPGWKDGNKPAPTIGETFMFTRKGGVIVTTLLGANYCDQQAGQAGTCGA